MKIKSNLRLTTALALFLTLHVNDSIAMELITEEGQHLPLQISQEDIHSSLLELESKEVSHSSPSFLGISEELNLYNTSCKTVQHLLSEEFKNSLNNLLTWITYNESKRLYAKHGDKFVAPFANSLIDANFNIIKQLVLKTVGLKDAVKAISILKGKEISPAEKPSEYISKNYSQQFYDVCRLKFITDSINEKIIAPYLVGPSLAYTIHKADLASLLQQHLFSQIQNFLEDKEPEMIRRAKQSLIDLEAKSSKASKEVESLTQKLAVWEDSEEARELKQLLADNMLELNDKEIEYNATKQIADDECSKMTYSQYLYNYLPYTSTDNQIKAKTLSSELLEYQQKKADLEKQLEKIIFSLKKDLWKANYDSNEIKEEINNITKALNGESQNSISIGCAKALWKGFNRKSKGRSSDEDSSLTIACAGMSWDEMLKPCPYIEYQYLKWGGQSGAVAQENEASNETLKAIGKILIQSTKAVGHAYLDMTGITNAVSQLKTDTSKEKLTKEMDNIFELYEKNTVKVAERAKERIEIIESEDTYKVTKALNVSKSYVHQFVQVSNTIVKSSKVIANYSLRLRDDVQCLGDSMRKAVRPITIAVKTMKYYPSVWAINYLGCFTLGVCVPYSTGIALVLGVMEDYDMWAPLLEKVTSVKNSIGS